MTTPNEIISMAAGPELDQAIHSKVMAATGPAPAYSSDDREAIRILERMPLYVASIDPARPEFNAARPFVAGGLQFEQTVKGDITLLRVTAATIALALCKAALIVLLKVPGRGKVDPVRSAERTAGRVAGRKTDGKKAAAKKLRSLPPQVPQPSARVTTRAPRPPIPPRKPFVAGQSPVGV